MRPSQLKRDEVQSLNMSPMQAERSSADGLNSSAIAALGNANKTRAASTPPRIVFMTSPLFQGASNAIDDVVAYSATRCCDGDHKNAPCPTISPRLATVRRWVLAVRVTRPNDQQAERTGFASKACLISPDWCSSTRPPRAPAC
jgi:hypothetical protein